MSNWISSGLSAIGIGAYCIHKKRCRKLSTCKTDPDVEDGNHGTDSLEQESVMSEVDDMQVAVASILHEYVTQARCTGTLPQGLSKPRKAEQLYRLLLDEQDNEADSISPPCSKLSIDNDYNNRGVCNGLGWY